MRPTFFIILLSFLCIPMLSFGQKENIKFSHYDVGNGILSSDIEGITQDKDGFLWIGGSRGINRFDGYDFVDFATFFDLDQTLDTKALLADPQGGIWIGTAQMGLGRYDPYKHQIKFYKNDPQDATSLSSDYVNALFIDAQQTLWVGHWFGLSKFDPATETFTHFPFQTAESQELFNYSVIEKIVEDRQGNLWIGTWGGGLHKFDKYKEEFTHFEHFETSEGSQNLWVKDLSINGNTLWVGTIGDGLYALNIETLDFQNFNFFAGNITKGFQRILTIYQKGARELWLGTEKGIILFDPVTADYSILSDTDKVIGGLLSNNVTKIFEDNHKGIWVAAGGLNYYNYSAAKFSHFHKEVFPHTTFDNEVQCFLEISPEEVWISTGKGVGVFNPKTQHLEMKNIFPGVVQKMLQLPDGKVAGLSRRDGLSIYNPLTNALANYKFDESKPEGILGDVVLDGIVDSIGNIWLATNRGINYFRTNIGNFIHFSQNNKYTKGLRSLTVGSLATTPDGYLWLINQRELLHLEYINHALLQDASITGAITDTTLYSFSTAKNNSLMRNIIIDGNNLWLFGGALMKYDPSTRTFLTYDKTSGLSSNDTKGAVIDDQKNVWATTNNGISYLNTVTNEITNFFAEDGLQSNRFNLQAITKMSNGNIFVGGNNGFNIIIPESIQLNDYLPPTRISNLLIYNQPISTLPSTEKDNISILNF